MIYLIIVLFSMNITLLIALHQVKQRLDIFDEWADTVDEFIDSEYVSNRKWDKLGKKLIGKREKTKKGVI